MVTLVFVLFWVLLAVGLVFLGLRGERGAAVARRFRGRGLPKAWLPAFAVILVAFGVIVPVAVVASVKSRDSIPRANVSDLTAQEKHGRELFGQRCRNCHTLAAANASASVGPNFDKLKPPEGLVLDAIHNGRSRGNGQMAADLVEGADAKAVAAFVAKAVGSKPQ